MKVTIKDIADIAGVSHSTVSRALNDKPEVTQVTKERIKKIAKSMNFDFNAGARSLKNNKTGNIAVVYDAFDDQFGPSLYMNLLFIELRHCLERMEMDAILLEAYHPITKISNIERLIRQQKVDGFLIVHGHVLEEDYISIKESGLPMVQVHMAPKFHNSNDLDFFVTDHIVGGKLAAEHLIKKGCKNIITVYPDDFTSYEYENRTQGFIDALSINGLKYNKASFISLPCTYLSGVKLFNKIKEQIDEIDGIFFQADIMAFGFLNAAYKAGIEIPKSLSVIGYDDAPVCESSFPTLTTIRQPRRDLAKLSTERIGELVKNNNNYKKVQKVLNPFLVEREST